MKLISIIVPVYNAQEYLNCCINSVIYQTYRDFELLLIDDGSTDKSGAMCDTFALLDKRIKVIHQKNGGTSSARNIGIEHATGEFITFLDADDSLEKNALEALSVQSDLVIGDFHFKGTDRHLLPADQVMDRRAIEEYLIGYLNKPTGYSMFVYVWGKLFKASIIKKHRIRFNERLKIFEDSLFNMHYLAYVDTACYVMDRIYLYNTSDHLAAGHEILNNPFAFKTAIDSICKYLNCTENLYYQAYVSFAIRQMICYFSLRGDRKHIKGLMTQIVYDGDIQFGLNYYQRYKGDSWLIPVLMKLKWITPLMWACEWRSR